MRILTIFILSVLTLVSQPASIEKLNKAQQQQQPQPQSINSNSVASNTNLIKNSKLTNEDEIGNELSSLLKPSEAKTISIIMQTLLPSMFGLFSNITSDDYKANFKEPCRFDTLLDVFKNLPPYFDLIATKYPNKPDLVAYYSMQLASTFLVNNGSLTMACLYNMLSLQTRLMTFSLDIMDNPEKNPQLVGLFGIFMKPVMGMLKKNSMMKIIEHVDRYDKNDDFSTVYLFNMLNVLYCAIGGVGILANMLLVVLLRRSSIVAKKRKELAQKVKPTSKDVKMSKNQEQLQLQLQHSSMLEQSKLNKSANGKQAWVIILRMVLFNGKLCLVRN
jgi:hypothetical protein